MTGPSGTRWRAALIAATLLILPHPAGAADKGAYIAIRVSASASTGKPTPPQPGQPARIDVSVRDPTSGFAMGGLGLAAWIVPDDGRGCGDWYARIGRAGELPDDVIPLIGFDIVQATRDHHLALVDPLLDLASANIRAVTTLPSAITAWAVARDGQGVATIAEGGGVSIADPSAGTIIPVALPATAHSLASGSRGFWAGMTDGRAIAIDARGKVAAALSIGAGPVTILDRGDDGFVALSGDGHARLLSPDGAMRRTRIDLPGPVRGAVVAPLANGLFALSAAGTELYAADLDDPATPRRIALTARAATIAADPSGRWIALADAAGATIAIFDTQVMRVRWTVNMPDPVIEMTFSDNFLYLMHRMQGGVTRLTFDPQGSAPGLAAIAAGLASAVPQEPGPLPHLVRIPAGGVLVASSRERRAYIVSESGAQAAMAMIPLRAGETAGVAIRQRGLVPAATPGNYTGEFKAPVAGTYRAIVRTDTPELLQCQSFTVGDRQQRSRPVVAARQTAPTVPAMKARVVGDRIILGIDGEGITAGRALLMRSEGGWRSFLEPVGAGPSTYVALGDPPPDPGRYQLFVEIVRPDGERATISQDIDIGGNGQ